MKASLPNHGSVNGGNARGNAGSGTARFFIIAVVLSVALYAAMIGLVYWQQEALIFHPRPLNADYHFTVAGVEEVKVAVDGAILSALHFKQPNAKGMVFFLHGNGGNVDSWLTSVDIYRRVNYDLFILDYRGFGKSTGHIGSEAQLHRDVLQAWQSIAPQYVGKKMVIYGRSLGSGLAAQLSIAAKPDLTVLVTPYLSLSAMAHLRYPWLPAIINRYPMRSDEWLPQIKNPVMILHGTIDSIIPINQAEALSRTRPSTELIVIPDAGHNDIHKFPLYLDTLAARLIGL